MLKASTRKRLEGSIGLDGVAWRKFMEVANFYNNLSHASAMTVLFYVKAAWPMSTVIGAEYDPGKRPLYQVDLRTILAGTSALLLLLSALDRQVIARSTQAAT